MRLIRYILEFQDQSQILKIGGKHRGIYVLYDGPKGILPNRKPRFDVVYIGMTDLSITRRLRSHTHSKRKKWSHFSIYIVWPNVTVEEIRELEGLFRYIYRRDGNANVFNRQKGYNKFHEIQTKDIKGWPALIKREDRV